MRAGSRACAFLHNSVRRGGTLRFDGGRRGAGSRRRCLEEEADFAVRVAVEFARECVNARQRELEGEADVALEGAQELAFFRLEPHTAD